MERFNRQPRVVRHRRRDVVLTWLPAAAIVGLGLVAGTYALQPPAVPVTPTPTPATAQGRATAQAERFERIYGTIISLDGNLQAAQSDLATASTVELQERLTKELRDMGDLHAKAIATYNAEAGDPEKARALPTELPRRIGIH